jgi:dTDP-4-dehydrorhamnose reductase
MTQTPRCFVTGAGGQLATEFEGLLPGEIFMAHEQALDLRDAPAVREALRGFSPDLVLHTAAWTDVDGAESDEAGAYAVNALGTRNLVAGLAGTHARLISFSTDYVFDGHKGTAYVETDDPHPLNAYGRTKLAQEHETLAWHRGTVVRTAWLFSPRGRNFVKTILAVARQRQVEDSGEPLRVVDDQVGCPTCARHLAEAVLEGARETPPGEPGRGGLGPGIYHMAGSGQCSWCELAREVVAVAGLPVAVVPITTAESGRPAPRPPFSPLTSERDIPRLPPWQDGVREVVEELLAQE